MIFQEFASAHGLIITHIEYDKWTRVPTIDHPHKRNGAYFHARSHAVIQNHATMTECAIWKNDDGTVIAQTQKERQVIERKLKQKQESAAKKAEWILSQCSHEKHAYLDSRGFGEETGLVWQRADDQNILCIPMRVGQDLVGVQMIDRHGDKRFLAGQRCGMAEYVIDGKGRPFLVEGYATGLSLLKVLTAMKIRSTIHVCFSAGNMLKVASQHKDGIIIADNDASQTGERIARASGLPYWMSDKVGEDFNNYERRVGILAAGLAIKKIAYSKK